jgi:hypothetical protein
MGTIRIEDTTHKRLNSLLYYFKENTPENKVTLDRIIKKLLDKYEGDLQ